MNVPEASPASLTEALNDEMANEVVIKDDEQEKIVYNIKYIIFCP